MSNFIKDYYWTICSIFNFGLFVGVIITGETSGISFWEQMGTLGILFLILLLPFLAGREHK